MKKILFIAMVLFLGLSTTTFSQEKENKVKVKKTSTVPQKIHNTFSKHKKYSGVKAKVKVDKPSTETKKD